MEYAKIVLVSVAAAVAYGIIHDQITARLCVEYFTIGHPDIFGTDSPTLLGLGWGVVATWWAGVLIGFPLAFASRMGSRPKRTAKSLYRPIAKLLAFMSVSAVLGGLTGFVLASFGWVRLTGPIADRVPHASQILFLTDLYAHNASYLSGFAGGLVLAARISHTRSSSPQRDVS